MNTDVMTAGTVPALGGEPENQLTAMGDAVSTASLQQLATEPAFDLIRWELQARVVADQPAEVIARRMCLPKSVVEQYEAAYFHVRPRLIHCSVVLREIIGAPINDVWMPSEIAKFWQWLGFTYGVSTLDQVIPPFLALDDKLRSRGLTAYLHPACSVREEFRILVASKLVPAAATLALPGLSLVAQLRSQARRRMRPAPVASSADVAALSTAECPAHDSRRDTTPRWKETG